MKETIEQQLKVSADVELWQAYHKLQSEIEQLIAQTMEAGPFTSTERLTLIYTPVWNAIDDLVRVCLTIGGRK